MDCVFIHGVRLGFFTPLHYLSTMKCFLLAAALTIAIAATEGRRYGEKRIPIKKEIVYGPKLGGGIIGKKKSGFLDGFHNRGFIGGSKKGLKKPIIKTDNVYPGGKGLLPEKTVMCPPRHCLQTQHFIPQECRRPQFFTYNGIQCPDCVIDICVGGGPLTPGGGGVWGDDLGPRGPFGPRGRFGSDIPLVPGGIDSQINGGLFTDQQFGGRFGQGGFIGGLGDIDQFGIQNGGRFGP